DVAAEAGHEEGLQLLGRRLEYEPPAVGAAVDDLLDDVEAGLPARVADAAAAAFPRLGHDEGRSGRKVLLDEGHPLIAGQRGGALNVLVAHLAPSDAARHQPAGSASGCAAGVPPRGELAGMTRQLVAISGRTGPCRTGPQGTIFRLTANCALADSLGFTRV